MPGKAMAGEDVAASGRGTTITFHGSLKEINMEYSQVFLPNVTRKQAVKEMGTWAEIIKKVEGGYMGFATENDYRTWKNQK